QSLAFVCVFHEHCGDRHLHSFPTRRSSDLTPTGPFVSGIVGHDLGGGGLWVATSNGSNAFTNSYFATLAPNARWVDVHTGEHWEDRKSTRLNSSHGSISYAVFCLKKKTHQQ